MTTKTDLERWDDAVRNLCAALWDQRKTVLVFMSGWLSAALVLAALWLITPERFCS